MAEGAARGGEGESDPAESGTWKYVCPGCQTTTDGEGNTAPEDKVRGGINTRGTAAALAGIHEAKTGHRTEVLPDG